MSASGALLVDKPAGWTSHDVIARLRRVLGEKRIGHAGTLDPMATGLLVVAVGTATRLLRFAQDGMKGYVGVLRLGEATSTLDKDGAVTATSPVPDLTEAEVAAAAAAMCGDQLQVPPMVSALKVDGRRLYEIAREGGEVERAPRPITVDSFALTRAGDVEWRFAVTCSPGTYVRVLAADLALRLGTLGHLRELRRTRSGTHDVADALTLAEVEARVGDGPSALLPPRALVASLPTVTVSEEQARALRQGRVVALEGTATHRTEVAAITGDGALVGVVHHDGERLRPAVMLVGDPASGQ